MQIGFIEMAIRWNDKRRKGGKMREIKFRAWKKSENRMIGWRELCEKDILRDVLDGVYLKQAMQFTGLKDKNGKEIYEGDCLGGIYGSLYVKYCDKCASLQLVSEEYCFACEGDIHWYEFVNDSDKEVIGNIYENTDLLGGTEKDF